MKIIIFIYYFKHVKIDFYACYVIMSCSPSLSSVLFLPNYLHLSRKKRDRKLTQNYSRYRDKNLHNTTSQDTKQTLVP